MSKITVSANGEECQVRIVGMCNGNPDTTVYAHKGGGGMGMKSSDLHGAYACSACHDEYDGRTSKIKDRLTVEVDFYDGMVRTQLILLEKGLISL